MCSGTQEKEREIKLLKMEYEEKLRNVREEAQNNTFSHKHDGDMNLLLKVFHLFRK